MSRITEHYTVGKKMLIFLLTIIAIFSDLMLLLEKNKNIFESLWLYLIGCSYEVDFYFFIFLKYYLNYQ